MGGVKSRDQDKGPGANSSIFQRDRGCQEKVLTLKGVRKNIFLKGVNGANRKTISKITIKGQEKGI